MCLRNLICVQPRSSPLAPQRGKSVHPDVQECQGRGVERCSLIIWSSSKLPRPLRSPSFRISYDGQCIKDFKWTEGIPGNGPIDETPRKACDGLLVVSGEQVLMDHRMLLLSWANIVTLPHMIELSMATMQHRPFSALPLRAKPAPWPRTPPRRVRHHWPGLPPRQYMHHLLS